MSVKVYKFSALPPTENAHLVLADMYQGHLYRNTLISLENMRREAFYMIEDELAGKDIKQLQQEVEKKKETAFELNEIVKKTRAEIGYARKKAKDKGEILPKKQMAEHKEKMQPLKESAQAAKIVYKTAQQELRALKLEARKSSKWAIEMDDLKLRRKRCMTSIRKTSPLDWESREHHDFAAKASFTSAHGRLPFKAWDRKGVISVVTRRNKNSKDKKTRTVDLTDSRCRVWHDFVPNDAWDKEIPNRTALQYTTLNIKYRGGEIVKVPFYMHRKLPAGDVKSVKVFRNTIADKEEWSVQFTIDSAENDVVVPGNQGKCGIDIGWRNMGESGIRVFTLADGEGNIREYCLPKKLWEKHNHVKHIAGIRSKRTHEFVCLIAEAIHNGMQLLQKKPVYINEEILRDEDGAVVLEDILLQSHHVKKWESRKRILNFVKDNELPEFLEKAAVAWDLQDVHLWQWMAFERRKVQNQRNGFFKNWSFEIAENYDHIILEKLALAAFGSAPDSNKVSEKYGSSLRAQKSFAALGYFREDLEKASAKRGGRLEFVCAKNTTKNCNNCGHKDEWEDKSALTHTCTGCGVLWDRDENAALNIRDRA